MPTPVLFILAMQSVAHEGLQELLRHRKDENRIQTRLEWRISHLVYLIKHLATGMTLELLQGSCEASSCPSDQREHVSCDSVALRHQPVQDTSKHGPVQMTGAPGTVSFTHSAFKAYMLCHDVMAAALPLRYSVQYCYSLNNHKTLPFWLLQG